MVKVSYGDLCPISLLSALSMPANSLWFQVLHVGLSVQRSTKEIVLRVITILYYERVCGLERQRSIREPAYRTPSFHVPYDSLAIS